MNTIAPGTHLLVDLYDCDPAVLDDLEQIQACMVKAAEESHCTVIKSVFHKFSTVGVSGVVVIGESHLSVHTWPEHGYAALDFFTCGNSAEPRKGLRRIRQTLGASREHVQEIHRGPHPPASTQRASSPRTTEGASGCD